MRTGSPAALRGTADDQKDTVAYATLLDMAHEEGLKSIETQLLMMPNEENGRMAIVQATVETSKGRFQGIGDADPGSVEAFLAPHLIRVAETRAKARALRDAVNVGVVSFEELDGASLPSGPSDPGSGAAPAAAGRSPRHTGNGSTGSRSRPAANRTRPVAASPPRAGNGAPEAMSEAQRRYLFRILAGQGYQREAAEERLKDLFQVERLGTVTKVAATKMIDQLLNPAPAGAARSGTPDF